MRLIWIGLLLQYRWALTLVQGAGLVRKEIYIQLFSVSNTVGLTFEYAEQRIYCDIYNLDYMRVSAMDLSDVYDFNECLMTGCGCQSNWRNRHVRFRQSFRWIFHSICLSSRMNWKGTKRTSSLHFHAPFPAKSVSIMPPLMRKTRALWITINQPKWMMSVLNSLLYGRVYVKILHKNQVGL